MKESNKKIISTFIRKTFLITFVLMTVGIFSNISIVAFADTTKWTNVGATGFSGGGQFTDIAIDSSGTPYVVYMDKDHGYKATVMKYENGSWTPVGSPGFSTGSVDYTDIAIDSNGMPYVVYRDGGYGNKATVMKYENGSWVPVGALGFSAGGAGYTNIVMDSNGTPYVVYNDGGYGNKATVMKYENGSWVPVGSPGFSTGQAEYTNIAIDSSGTPYVVYSDLSNGWKATAMKYENGSWTTIGSPSFSAAEAYYTNIAIDYKGMPYVMYNDAGYGNKATVMKYENGGWTYSGSPGFSVGGVEGDGIAIDSNGTPYVSFNEYANYPSTISRLTVMKLSNYAIGLSQTGTYNFNSQAEGYSQVPDKSITVTKTGNGDISNLAVNLTSGDTNSFNIVAPSTNTLNDTTGSTAFTIQPKDGLPVGTYTSTVTVTSDNNISKSFDVSFTVNPPIDISDVNSIGDINVINGTNIDEIGLPASVNITLSDSTTISAAVTWDNGTPSYDGTIAGTYEFKGTLTLPSGVINSTTKYATAKVVVAPAGAVISPAVNSVTVTPSIANIVQGGSVKLTANVNVTGMLDKTVNWLSSDGSKVSVDNNGLVIVATDAALGDYTITAVSTADGNKSGAATITVTNAPVVPPAPPIPPTTSENQTSPIIKKQPSNQTVRKGNTANFSIQVARTEPLTYQWKKGDIYLSDEDNFRGTRTANFKIKNVSKSDAGEYSCIVTDGNFNVTTSSAATLRVTSKSSNSSSASDSSKVSDTAIINTTSDANADEIAILNALNTKTTKTIIVNFDALAENNKNPLISQGILAVLKSNPNKTLIIKTSNSNIEIKSNMDGQVSFTENGAIIAGFKTVGNAEYYLDDNGILQTGWIKAQDGSWYHFNDNSGARDSGWFQDIDGAKYYLDEKTGIMKTGWLNDNGITYYLKSNGAMAIGWFQDVDGRWYYFYPNGAMAKNTIIDGYYVDENGVWV